MNRRAVLALTALALGLVPATAHATPVLVCGHDPNQITVADVLEDCPDAAFALVQETIDAAMPTVNNAVDCTQATLSDPMNTSVRDVADCMRVGAVTVAERLVDQVLEQCVNEVVGGSVSQVRSCKTIVDDLIVYQEPPILRTVENWLEALQGITDPLT